ncbi:alpha/beta hydrolase [Vineibacter terrae]|uniref:alpha/beta fold hydrolase n=1 Tax=Vineibacter terrae TaxID=2586908 RepID=UPI002E2F2A86|nr:alpha/beta hydrolase [Vineibacter terrae]HEX2889832.1 alpha/beta hydrolase [Vineibacter terrae]
MRSDDEAEASVKRFRMSDGVELVADAWGPPDAPPAILLHGGGQTRHAWKRTAQTLAAQGYHALAVDLRGHGDSGWSPDGDYGMDRFAADVRTLAQMQAAKPILIGASLGGISSLLAEGDAPQSVAAALVLVDITPKVDPQGVARIRGFMASHIDTGFASVDEAADAVAAYLPHRPRPRSVEGLRKNLRLGDDGRYRWHYDPAFVHDRQTRDDSGREQRLSIAAARIEVPVLLVRGGSSELVSQEAARAFIDLVPHATYVDVRGAGHMVAGDVNDVFSQEVVRFLEGLPPGLSTRPSQSAVAS